MASIAEELIKLTEASVQLGNTSQAALAALNIKIAQANAASLINDALTSGADRTWSINQLKTFIDATITQAIVSAIANGTLAAGTPSGGTSLGFTVTGLVVEGDSISAGGGNNPDPWPAQLSRATSVPIINISRAGTTLAQMNDDFGGGQTGSKLTGVYNTAFLMGGTNDFAHFNSTVDDTIGRIQSYCGKVRAMGKKVVVGSITLRGDFGGEWNSTLEAKRVDHNTRLRNTWSSFADGFIDTETALTLANTYDQVHPVNEGARTLMVKIKAGLGI